MNEVTACVLAVVVFCLAAGISAQNTDCGPLCDYVYDGDPTYTYGSVPLAIYPQETLTTYVLNMTSQRWFDEALSDTPVWWHYLVVHVPNELLYTEHAFYQVSLGQNGDGLPRPDDNRHVRETRIYAERTGMVTASLRMIPNQPIVFTDDPTGAQRTEDAIIAWTWAKFIEEEGTPESLLLQFPMVKAAARGMDTIHAFVQSLVSTTNIDKFMVAGESKRGWVTWLMGAVDTRVVAMAPTVLSCLNTVENMHHYYQAFGGWPTAFAPYWVENITAYIDEPRTALMESLIDPHAYRHLLTMPKLYTGGASDEFFSPDDTWYFFNDLVGEKYLWLVENAGHELGQSNSYEDYWRMLETFYIAIIQGFSRPVFSWTRSEDETSGSITVTTQVRPTRISYWWAETVNRTCDEETDICRRDFRRIIGVIPSLIEWFEGTDVDDLGGNVFRATVSKASDQMKFKAFVVKIYFPGPTVGSDEREFIFTTEVNIIPDVLPYPDCAGAECRGQLL